MHPAGECLSPPARLNPRGGGLPVAFPWLQAAPISWLSVWSFKLTVRQCWKEKICCVQQTEKSSWLGCAGSPWKQLSWGAICSSSLGYHSHKTHCRAGRVPVVLSLTGMGKLAPAPEELAKSSLKDGSKGPTLLSQGCFSVCFCRAYPQGIVCATTNEGREGSRTWLSCSCCPGALVWQQ